MLYIIIIAAIAALVFYISRRPENFIVSRSLLINAPADIIFAEVNSLRRWDSWSPWAKLDPDAKNEFYGPESGEGAGLRWNGNKKVGAGDMRITESRAHGYIRLRLEFFRPMKAVNITEFTFRPEDSGTLVIWDMSGRNNFIGKAMGLFMNCEKMVGSQFSQGLQNLKQATEGKK